MKVIAKTIAAALFGYFVFQVNILIGFFGLEKVVGPFSYPAIYDFIEPSILLAALPELILYFIIGWFVFERNSKYIWSFIVASIFLKIYLVTHLFTDHSTLPTKFWAYFSYTYPGLAVILGNMLKKQLTRTKSTPAAGRS